ncbi:hypothetical protein [Candidatus Nanohalovita haloferacivicina]|nr:hypothetical protein HBNXNv_0344 [Candidatus Nanohalobia archaeon BNXNv]
MIPPAISGNIGLVAGIFIAIIVVIAVAIRNYLQEKPDRGKA